METQKYYSVKFASWFTGTVLNPIRHPKYGVHQITPEQIAWSPKEYKNKLFKAIDKEMKGEDAPILRKKIKELRQPNII